MSNGTGKESTVNRVTEVAVLIIMEVTDPIRIVGTIMSGHMKIMIDTVTEVSFGQLSSWVFYFGSVGDFVCKTCSQNRNGLQSILHCAGGMQVHCPVLWIFISLILFPNDLFSQIAFQNIHCMAFFPDCM